MSQQNDSGRVKGYVVGSNKAGKEWVLRVREADHVLNGCKLSVSTIQVGTKLYPGLAVTFKILYSPEEPFASDVAADPQAEEDAKTLEVADDAPSIGVVVIKHRGRYSLYFTDAQTIEEAQASYEVAGAEGERVVCLVRQYAGEAGIDDDAAISALSSLALVLNEMEDSIGQVLERFLSKVFLAGVKAGKRER